MALSRRIRVVLVVAVLAVAAFPGWYFLSPLFIVLPGEADRPAGSSLVSMGTFHDGEPGHPASGTALILATGTGHIVRFENFSVLNGPDLYIYLANDPRLTTEKVNLGHLTVTVGSVNYDVPPEIDPGAYAYVVVWCLPFRVLFGYAPLQSA